MIKKLKTIKSLKIDPDVISVFASGSSILKIPKRDIRKIYQESYCIWLNFAPVIFNKFIDCLMWMDWKVSVWIDKFYNDNDVTIPKLWTRDMAFYKQRKLKIKSLINCWFDDESDYLEKTNLTFVKCLLELSKHFPDKKILLFGLDLKGEKWYSQFLKKGDDNWKHKKDQKIDLEDCQRDFKLLKNKNIINCTANSPCKYFKKRKWQNYIKYNNILRLKGPSGLGDSIYSYPIIKYFIEKKFDVEILTRYKDIFKNLDCKVRPYFYFNDDIDFNYVPRKFHKRTSQFEDMCILSGITKKIKLEINYEGKRKFKTKKKICVIQRPYWPMNELEKRVELVPDYSQIQKLIINNQDYYYVMVGVKNSLDFEIKGIDETIEKTSIDDLFKIINASDMVITQIGWTIALAEILNKKIFVIFSVNGLESDNWFFNTITPKKVITKQTSSYCIDNWTNEKINKKFQELKCSK